MKPDIGSESRFLLTPPAFNTLVSGFSSEYRHAIWYGKTRMVWLPDGEEKFEDVLIRFDRMYERDGQTHTQTDTT